MSEHIEVTRCGGCTSELWDRLLTVQAEITTDTEVSVLFSDPTWHKANSILDLGTGNGAYLRRVSEWFPAKRYIGVDNSPDLVSCAIRDNGHHPIEYRCTDMFQLVEEVDFIIMRLVLRYLPDHGQVISLLSRLLRNGGSAMIVDADVRSLRFWPEARNLSALFYKLDAGQRERCRAPGRVIDAFQSQVAQEPRLRVGAFDSVTISSTVGNNLALMREQYRLALNILERKQELAADADEARQEWGTWCERPMGFIKYDMEVIVVEKVA